MESENKQLVTYTGLGYNENIFIGDNISITVNSRQTSYEGLSQLGKISKLCDNIGTMVDCMNSIGKTYKYIDIQNTDIFLTLADTGEIVSVNQLVKDWREHKNC